MMKICNVCESQLEEPIFSTTGEISITSLCELIPFKSQVYYCKNCGHTQTPAMVNIDEYYADNYKILIDSEEEDQIISFPDGRREFRFDLQVNTLLEKIDVVENAKILDFGCAKSTTLKKICERRKDITPYLFDVSEIYTSFWSTFVVPDNWATFEPKPEWENSFDVITSFFSLEHVSAPVDMLEKIYGLLNKNGYFYCIIPNMFKNTADFAVADHVNHFSESSLRVLLQRTGFEILEVDTDIHYGAFVLVARKVKNKLANNENLEVNLEMQDDVMKIAQYWGKLSENIKSFTEQKIQGDSSVAIYGSGFYGTFIASCIDKFEYVKVFIDQNPHRQGLQLLGKDIVSPESTPEDIQIVFVGLNPVIARKTIALVDSLACRKIQYYFLPSPSDDKLK